MKELQCKFHERPIIICIRGAKLMGLSLHQYEKWAKRLNPK